MKKVLVDRPLHREAFELLSKNVEVIEIYDDDTNKIEETLKVVDGVICSVALKMREHQISIAPARKGVCFHLLVLALSGRVALRDAGAKDHHIRKFVRATEGADQQQTCHH